MTEDQDTLSHTMPLPQGAGPGRLILCETSGVWAVALQRELAGSDVCIRQSRSVAEGWDLLAGCPSSFLVVELTRTNLLAVLERMAWWDRDFPWARMAAAIPRSWEACEVSLRAMGAVCVVTSTRQAPKLAQVVRRHLQSAPRPQRSLADEIWARLPWGRR